MTGSLVRAGGWVALVLLVADVVWRQLTRTSIGALTAGVTWSPWWSVLGVMCAALLVSTPRPSRRWARQAAWFLALFAAGSVWQTQLGARLQSDGFYYYAYARSIWFDGDVDLTNDYRLLGLDDAAHRHLFTPTATGYAQTTWAVGPAITWSPFVGAGHAAARWLRARGADVSVDGTSFPYRQAVCLAGLFYGLVGLFICYDLARNRFGPRASTAAVVAAGAGSFVLWYLIREPTMSHSVSMAAVAGVVWLWLRFSASRSAWAWAALGLAGGLMATVRWQNAVVLLLPAATLAAAAWRTRADGRGSALTLRNGAAFGLAAGIGFLPQMFAWHAIYGQWLARSPIAPAMFWTAPEIADVLWSSRNGLFATSPALYLAAIGLVLLWRQDRRLSAGGLVVFSLMIWTNAAVEDWYGGAGYGGRRFDSIIPFFVLGLAAFGTWLTVAVRRRPAFVAAAGLGLLVVWNIALMGVARSGLYRIGQPISFADIGGAQAALLHDGFGHPASYPANLLYGLRHGVAPGRFDVLGPSRFLGDPSRQYGRVDLGPGDDDFVLSGWHAPERSGDVTFRWARAEAGLIVPLDRAADLLVQIRAMPFQFDGAAAQQLSVDVNGSTVGAAPLAGDWQTVEIPVPRARWRAGVNRVTLRFARETRPADVGAADGRLLAAAVDYVRVAVLPAR